MLSKDRFKEEVKRLLIFYPNWTIKTDDPKVMKAWYGMFESMDEAEFVKMIDEYILTESYNPTVSGLMKNYEDKKKPKFVAPWYKEGDEIHDGYNTP